MRSPIINRVQSAHFGCFKRIKLNFFPSYLATKIDRLQDFNRTNKIRDNLLKHTRKMD